MDTTAAALQANVTADTIRTWCRRGAIAAVKQTGRWIIDATSLAARIAIGAMRSKRRERGMSIDLATTYTWTPAGRTSPVTVTPAVSSSVEEDGTVTVVTGLAPLLADHINAIEQDGDRLHTLTVLAKAEIVYCDTPDDAPFNIPGVTSLDRGQICVQYAGTRDLLVDTVVDLALRLRNQLGL
ncbi:helix-turn-helix domain-containing protein [Streptomyces cinereoruber]|uniref:helix-turn-helix domain-containing protein n=1 Tax=Streptomyces cinereoruber TaxID=67260 RepID=UPI003633CEA6